jgi:hypothetical protein
MDLLTISQIEICSVAIPTAMSDSKSFNTLLLVVMISFKNHCIFIHDVSYLTLQVLFYAWWASIDVGSKRPIACNNSCHSPLWCSYLHCGIEETGIPDTICIICHQVLHPTSEHGTSSMGKHLLTNLQIGKLNKITESEVTEVTISTVDERVLAILKRQ